MTPDASQVVNELRAAAIRFGADLVGTVEAGALRDSPSHRILPSLDRYYGVGTSDAETDGPLEVAWPEEVATFVVLGLAHPADEPALDWWGSGISGGTEGNHRLIEIAANLAEWLEEEHGLATVRMPYHIERGGVFLKDAAVLAGLGCLGRNNMLVTPEFGPRVRLRVLGLTVPLPKIEAAAESSFFDPCEGCPAPCRKVCPQEAFAQCLYSADDYGVEALPGRTGAYGRLACNVQMDLDQEKADRASGSDTPVVRYCRKCELACVQGRAR